MRSSRAPSYNYLVMKRPRLALWFIILLTFLTVAVDLPKAHINFQIGSLKIDRLVEHPKIDLMLGKSRVFRDLNPKLGLDLAGGSHIVLEADFSKISQKDRDDALESAKNIIDRRVNTLGVAEPLIQTSKVGGHWRIIVDLPGVQNVEEAIKLIGTTAQLDFRELKVDGQTSSSAAAALENFVSTGLTGRDLKKASPAPSTQSIKGGWEVQIVFTEEGAKKFEQITTRNLGKPLAIFLDNQFVEAPIVQGSISGGNAVISGNFTADSAKQLAVELNAGALPAPIAVVQQRNVGPTLGSQSIDKSLIAAIIGLASVAVFMAVSYRLAGILADIALLLYTLLVLAIFKLIPVTLSLAGIAGFILSIGMAVDANILIFERIAEEKRWGRDPVTALTLGFKRAWSSIRDSNVSSLITAFILFQFGTGLVKGFALTLAIGILLSMFSAITVTRTFMKFLYARKAW